MFKVSYPDILMTFLDILTLSLSQHFRYTRSLSLCKHCLLKGEYMIEEYEGIS